MDRSPRLAETFRGPCSDQQGADTYCNQPDTDDETRTHHGLPLSGGLVRLESEPLVIRSGRSEDHPFVAIEALTTLSDDQLRATPPRRSTTWPTPRCNTCTPRVAGGRGPTGAEVEHVNDPESIFVMTHRPPCVTGRIESMRKHR